MSRTIVLGLMTIALVGCTQVQRNISISSDPPGALVYLNDQEAGRTPMTRDFTWYGTYEVVLRKEGYQTTKTGQRVIAPWWQWPPFDLLADLSPVRLKDKHSYHFTMSPSPPPPSADEMLGRAEEMRLK